VASLADHLKRRDLPDFKPVRRPEPWLPLGYPLMSLNLVDEAQFAWHIYQHRTYVSSYTLRKTLDKLNAFLVLMVYSR